MASNVFCSTVTETEEVAQEVEEAAEEGRCTHAHTHIITTSRSCGDTSACVFLFAVAEFVETEEQIQDEPTGKHCFQPTPCS